MNKIENLSDYFQEYQKSIANPEDFWSKEANNFYWRKKWDRTLEWNFKEPNIKWFLNGKLNLTESIFEKNLFINGDKPAIIWEPNDPNEKGVTLTYKELFMKVCEFANV